MINFISSFFYVLLHYFTLFILYIEVRTKEINFMKDILKAVSLVEVKTLSIEELYYYVKLLKELDLLIVETPSTLDKEDYCD